VPCDVRLQLIERTRRQAFVSKKEFPDTGYTIMPCNVCFQLIEHTHCPAFESYEELPAGGYTVPDDHALPKLLKPN
jgi:hypothetical protein